MKNKQWFTSSLRGTRGNWFKFHKIRLKYKEEIVIVKTGRVLNRLLREDVGFASWGSFQGQVRQSILNSLSTADLIWEA